MVWVRRRQRHRYLPLWPNPDDDRDTEDPSYVDDEDLQPLPAVVDRLRRTIRQQAPALLESAPVPSTVSEYLADPSPASPPVVGPSGLELADLSDLVPDRGLGLIGAGADSAARGLLVAVLTSGGTHDPDAQGAVVIPEATLRRLLASEADQVKDLQRLCVTADLDEAIAEIEAIVLRRQRLLDEHDADDVEALRADPTNPPMPQLVLLADVPTGQQVAHRLVALLEQGPSTNLAAVLLGEWPPGSTATIEADGRTAGGDGKPGSIRVAVLDQPTTADLLGVITEAEPDRADDSSPAGEADGELGEPPTLNAEPAVSQGTTAAKVKIRLFGKVAVLDDEGQPVPGLRQNAGGLARLPRPAPQGSGQERHPRSDLARRTAAPRSRATLDRGREPPPLHPPRLARPVGSTRRQHRWPLPPQPRCRRRRPLALGGRPATTPQRPTLRSASRRCRQSWGSTFSSWRAAWTTTGSNPSANSYAARRSAPICSLQTCSPGQPRSRRRTDSGGRSPGPHQRRPLSRGRWRPTVVSGTTSPSPPNCAASDRPFGRSTKRHPPRSSPWRQQGNPTHRKPRGRYEQAGVASLEPRVAW